MSVLGDEAAGMTTSASRIAAIVVTYNRPDKLARVLQAIAAQDLPPNRTYVLDNAPGEATRRVVQDMDNPAIIHVELPSNIGGAGGFHEGIRIACADGCDMVWLMDDDVYPAPSALAELVAPLEGLSRDEEMAPSFACSAVQWVDGSIAVMNVPSPSWDWPRYLTQKRQVALVRSASFVSVLIPRWAIERHGLPIKEYFIWYDDIEYTQRISRSGPGLYCPRSVVVHDTPENVGVDFSRVTPENLWKYKFGARNETSFLAETSGRAGARAMLSRVRAQMRAGKVPMRLRLAIYQSVIKGAFFRPQRQFLEMEGGA